MFKKDFWVTFFMAFILSWLILQLPFFQPAQKSTTLQATSGSILVETTKPHYSIGESVYLKISVLSGTTLAEFPSTYPMQPFTVKKDNLIKEFKTPYSSQQGALVAKTDTPLLISYDPWNAGLFKEPGKYTIEVPYNGTTYTTHFEISGENPFTWVWSTVFIKPTYNILVYMSLLLGNHLLWGIIVLTILVRLILLVPSQRAMESQKAMQIVQPKLKEIQTKYKGDQQKISLETVRIMKEHKVNPLGGCLPILLQIPILLAIFTVIQGFNTLGFTVHLYEPLMNINVQTIQTNVFGLFDLSKAEMYVLPLVVALLQYYQMDLSMKKIKGKITTKKDPNMPDPEVMQKWMKFGLPALIWFMSITLPSGVSIYWAISTIFSIGQQWIVNKEPITL